MEPPENLFTSECHTARRESRCRATRVVDSRQVDLWCLYPREANDEALLARYHALLDESEREQELRLYFAHDRRRHVMTRALVRTVLSRYVDIDPREWTFKVNRHGRPEIVNPQPAAQSLTFSVAHTNGLVVLGVAHERALGVDAENICMHEAAVELSDRFFAAEEAESIMTLPRDRQQRRFFECWTLKESYMKARGTGMALPMDQFSFRFPREDQVAMSIHPALNDLPERWQFWQFCLSSKFVLAVCAARLLLEPPRLVVRQVVPLMSEREIDASPLRVLEPAPPECGARVPAMEAQEELQ